MATMRQQLAALKARAAEPVVVAWQPRSRPQLALIKCKFPEVFLGGARGGGKTDAVLGKWAIKEAAHGEHFNAVMFRRTTVSSEDAIERSRQIYTPLGGKFNESKLIWRMPKGGRVAFAYLDSIADADEYQGRNLTDIWVEEAGQYPDPGPIDRLFGTMRSAHGVPTQMILTANPGGAGQHWLAARYRLIPFPRGPSIVEVERASGHRHQGRGHPVAHHRQRGALGQGSRLRRSACAWWAARLWCGPGWRATGAPSRGRSSTAGTAKQHVVGSVRCSEGLAALQEL